MVHLDICSFENSVPEGFADWVKIWDMKNDEVHQKVQALLSENQLEEALEIHYNTLMRWFDFDWYTHRWNNRIH